MMYMIIRRKNNFPNIQGSHDPPFSRNTYFPKVMDTFNQST